MFFKKFNSIENAYRPLTIDHIRALGLANVEWCATVKVHGSNFSFWLTDTEFRVGKRTCLIGNENFCGSHAVVAKYEKSARSLYKGLKLLYDFDTLGIYGEIFGGKYDHPDVPRVKEATVVQKEVQYCPHNDFYLFAVAMYKDNNLVRMANKDEIEAFGQLDGFIYSKIMHRGALDELLALNPVFEDPIHKIFNLPSIENNMAEGWVIEPVDPYWFSNGERVVLKHKNPAFMEKKERAKKTPKEPLTEEELELYNELLSYSNEARLKNVLSHVGEVNQKEFGKLLGLFSSDIHEDFMKDFRDRFCALAPANQKRINKIANADFAAFIRTYFQNIIDGTF